MINRRLLLCKYLVVGAIGISFSPSNSHACSSFFTTAVDPSTLLGKNSLLAASQSISPDGLTTWYRSRGDRGNEILSEFEEKVRDSRLPFRIARNPRYPDHLKGKTVTGVFREESSIGVRFYSFFGRVHRYWFDYRTLTPMIELKADYESGPRRATDRVELPVTGSYKGKYMFTLRFLQAPARSSSYSSGPLAGLQLEERPALLDKMEMDKARFEMRDPIRKWVGRPGHFQHWVKLDPRGHGVFSGLNDKVVLGYIEETSRIGEMTLFRFGGRIERNGFNDPVIYFDLPGIGQREVNLRFADELYVYQP